MQIGFAEKEITPLLMDFHTITNFRIALFDTNYEECFGYPDAMCDFCYKIRESELGKSRCLACDAKGLHRAKSEKKAHIYICHAGLLEVCAPIILENEILGYLMIGQIKSDNTNDQSIQNMDKTAEELRISKMLLRAHYDKMHATSEAYILSAVKMMTTCIAFIKLEKLILLRQDNVAVKAYQYIEEHYHQNLRIEQLCEIFDVGKTTLCNEVKRMYGKSFGEIIYLRRMERASELLCKTNLYVNQVAERCGFEDYNYFSKQFKKYSGMSPREFRKNL